GEEGQLFLSDSEVIHINKPVEDVDPEDPDDNTGGGGSSSGGSLGLGSLLFAGLLAWRRKRSY
ncbi:GlyGly-CTERM sorting domain-containing protein, partial [Vibrio sp. F13]